MLYLILAILSSAAVSIIMRLTEGRIQSKPSMLACNYLMCTAMAALYTRVPAVWDGMPFTAGLGLISGALYLISFLLLQWNIGKNGVVLSALFMKLGVLVPIVMSLLAFGELPSWLQTLGIVLAIGAILLINLDKNARAASAVGLIILLVCGGMTDAVSKIYEELGAAPLKDVFLLITFAMALVLCVLLAAAGKQRPGKADLLWGLLLGVPNYFSARFLLLSLSQVPAVAAYPTYSVATIILISLAGVLVWKERLSVKRLVAMGVIMVSLVLMNL